MWFSVLVRWLLTVSWGLWVLNVIRRVLMFRLWNRRGRIFVTCGRLSRGILLVLVLRRLWIRLTLCWLWLSAIGFLRVFGRLTDLCCE